MCSPSEMAQRPTRVSEQTWPATTPPLVSVLCTAFNQERFIAQCLDGFLSQETTFPVEVIVHDDASTDSTTTIVRDYERRYPSVIHTIVQPVNVYSQGLSPVDLAFQHSRGQYIATCEGDDYWISSAKLQRQVEYFLSHPDGVLSGCRSYVTQEGAATPYDIEPRVPPGVVATLTPHDMLRGRWYFKTLTRMVPRTVYTDLLAALGDAKNIDWLVVMYCVERSANDPSRFGFIDEVMGVYREHSGGVWSSRSDVLRARRDIEALEAGLTFTTDEQARQILGQLLGDRHDLIAQSASVPAAERRNHALWLVKRRPWGPRAWGRLAATLLGA
jgi:glycosyltransferase involved in cell wall biosynthesis